MTIGTSIFLLAVGAILRFAVADSWDGVDLAVVGLILMACGAIGLLFGLIQMASTRRRPGDPY
ncbi:MAG TPA: DUF6458 family protein [Acidimicrobiales bacterium]|nr:DUF6458 family protein [Acidimicrobiales bacterium]